MIPQIVTATYALGALAFLGPAAHTGPHTGSYTGAAPAREAAATLPEGAGQETNGRRTVRRDAVIPTLPLTRPRCPERAPEGWEFVGAGVPNFGLPYDVYRRLRADGTYEYRQVYCL
ncbi:hypothetical protein ACQPZZ_31040 [Microbispora sp. CA-135349]|uniref:hypothetical protein n=1 Tax=Microbispora sp. CA-135349 TaxID=3239953 RepID=UPI003D8EFA38